jgi:lipopolysaccharide/colanic/teichoic acid biosynthesis glycosyltransferase
MAPPVEPETNDAVTPPDLDSLPTPRPYRLQRMLDWAVLIALSPVLVPVGLLLGLAVALTSRGPVLFRQERVGLNGERFQVYKFRSMVDGDNPLVPDPTRITRVGAVLRRWSLDELPQLLNVAKGEMSVVGPRPTVASQVERYTQDQARRLSVRPGLTGLAQVSGRNSLPWADRIDLDLAYVDSRSLRRDVGILVRTVSTVVTGEGAEGHDADDPMLADR